MDKRDEMRIIVRMKRISPQQSLDNLDVPAETEFAEDLRKLAAQGNKIVQYTVPNIVLAVHPPTHLYVVTIVTPRLTVESRSFSYREKLPKTSNLS